MRPVRYRFAEYELDAASGELLGPAGRQRLEPQPARVLTLLVERAGELLTREELQRAVWPDTHVDLDQGLNYCIRQVRTALGETAESARFIETLPRRGYRFVAPVAAVESDASDAPSGKGAAPAPGSVPKLRRKLWMAVVGFFLVATIAAIWLDGRRSTPTASQPPIRVAVLPFHGRDRPPTPWEDLLTETLVVELTGRGGGDLAVVGPATTAPLAESRLPQGELGSRLGVDFVLSGGIRSDGKSLFAQLLGAPGGEHLWASTQPLGEPDADGRTLAAAVLVALAELDAGRAREPRTAR